MVREVPFLVGKQAIFAPLFFTLCVFYLVFYVQKLVFFSSFPPSEPKGFGSELFWIFEILKTVFEIEIFRPKYVDFDTLFAKIGP